MRRVLSLPASRALFATPVRLVIVCASLLAYFFAAQSRGLPLSSTENRAMSSGPMTRAVSGSIQPTPAATPTAAALTA
jgi:hypothetical protein